MMRLKTRLGAFLISAALAVGAALAQDAQTCAPPGDQSLPKPRRIRVGGEGMQRQLVYRVKPKYPEEARKAHIKGTVRLRIVIGEDGNVKEVQSIEGEPVLVKAASEAVRQWRYRPTTLNGSPVEVDTRVGVNFH